MLVQNVSLLLKEIWIATSICVHYCSCVRLHLLQTSVWGLSTMNYLGVAISEMVQEIVGVTIIALTSLIASDTPVAM